MQTEIIKWYQPEEKMPDDCTDVLLDMQDGSYEIAYHDEDGWHQTNTGICIEALNVIAWTDFPKGLQGCENPLLDAAKAAAEHERAHWDNQDQDDTYREPTWLAELERVIEEVENA